MIGNAVQASGRDLLGIECHGLVCARSQMVDELPCAVRLVQRPVVQVRNVYRADAHHDAPALDFLEPARRIVVPDSSEHTDCVQPDAGSKSREQHVAAGLSHPGVEHWRVHRKPFTRTPMPRYLMIRPRTTARPDSVMMTASARERRISVMLVRVSRAPSPRESMATASD